MHVLSRKCGRFPVTQIYSHGLEAGAHPQRPEPETPKGSEVRASRDEENSRQSS
ncbi:msr5734 [Mesorhizobium japonicum MAFF 303099]|uniref:Msr5734 protein n=1 Tax=Mesorhizobium japonicum (strain LMG 29417 / CECT 9101 / MAFF 303099) TaxID=266835 RepID=Q98B46_RHILO|nr:msr5734 [Mesorhizobium japonicum MAFF 303099]